MKQLSTGISAPDFELKSLSGQSFRLSEALRNGPVVLAFYKASCPTCQLTFPYLQTIYSALSAEFRNRIWGISQDDPAETAEFVKQLGIEFPILLDEYPYPVSTEYGLEFVPTIFIVGRDGMIQLSDYGFSKTTLSRIAELASGDSDPVILFPANDGLPERRPG
jgi:peroxiredoxin